MKNPFSKITRFIIGVLLCECAVGAVTLEQLTTQALQNNAEIRFYEAEVAAAKGVRTQAGLWKNPEISGEYGERRIFDSGNGLQDQGTTRSLSIAQTFEFPGKGSLRKAIAAKNIELAELGLEQFRLALKSQVRNLAIQHRTASENAEVAEEVSERSAALVQLLRERPTAGAQQLLELRVIGASLIDLKKSASESLRVRDEALIEMNSFLGFPTGQKLNLTDDPALPSFKEGEMNRLILRGLSNNLQLKMRSVELEKAVREVTAAKLEAMPDFSVGPFFTREKAGQIEETFGMILSTTLPLWNWNQGNIAVAGARKTQADALLLDARRKVERELTRQFRAYERRRKLLSEISEEIPLKMREAAELADRQYRLGAIPISLYLEAQRESFNVQRTRNETLVEAVKSQSDLELLMGGSLLTQ